METKTAVLAGGCFWGLQELFRKQPGVINTEAGYTGHAEALKITYDPTKTRYEDILDFFFRIHDPTTLNRQGNDVGTSYRSAIFYANTDEKKAAKTIIARVNDSGRWNAPVITTLEPLTTFSPAEEEHQDYLQKHPGGYTCHFIRGEPYA